MRRTCKYYPQFFTLSASISYQQSAMVTSFLSKLLLKPAQCCLSFSDTTIQLRQVSKLQQHKRKLSCHLLIYLQSCNITIELIVAWLRHMVALTWVIISSGNGLLHDDTKQSNVFCGLRTGGENVFGDDTKKLGLV